jgi:hypothetical protein
VVAAKNSKNVAVSKMPNELQDKTEQIIEKLQLEEKLLSFGEVHLVGNAALKTTVKPDIDYQIYTENRKFLNSAISIKEILEGCDIKDVTIRELKQSNKVLVTGKYQEWAIDISLTEPQNDYLNDAYAFYKEFYDKFNETNRKIIIKLKKYFLKKKMLWNGMSYYIYRAVIEESAIKPEDIFNYLKENNINISRFTRGR